MKNALKEQIRTLCEESANMAIDQFGENREFDTLDEAVEAYGKNIADTLLEWGVKDTRSHALARTYYEACLYERGCSKKWVKS